MALHETAVGAGIFFSCWDKERGRMGVGGGGGRERRAVLHEQSLQETEFLYVYIKKKKKKKEELRKIPYSSSHPDTQQNSSVSAALYLYTQMPESKRKNMGYEKHCTCKHRLTPTSGVMLQILQRSLGEDQQEEEAAGHPTHSSWKSHGPLYKVHTVISLFYFNASH